MKRREFITLIGGATAAWPLAARAQQPKMPVIGFLHIGSPVPYAGRVAAFRQGLGDLGFVEGKNVAIEYRWAEGNYERLPEMARDLVRRGVSVIFAGGGVTSAPVAKAATATIPIVFATGVDPVAAGFVNSLARPEGNVTGVSFMSGELGTKRLGLLNMLAPSATIIGQLVNPTNSSVEAVIKEIQAVGSASGRQFHVFEARSPREIDSAFEALVRRRVNGLLIHSDPFFTSRHLQIATLGTKAAIPAVYPSREFVEVGGIMSYGADVRDEYRKAGVYAGRILRGAKPADLPVVQPTKFELVVNLTTAKVIGLAIPDKVMALADQVIE